jgi:pimeloyl-ACP methyl ester carboxylesterase
MLHEAKVLLDLGLGLTARNKGLPEGQGQRVMVLPGFGASDFHTALLRKRLAALGYAVEGWGLGRNHGVVGKLLPKLIAHIRQRVATTGAPLRLVGWSLGGYLAREVARDAPELVAQVITLGSPITGGPKYTAFAPYYRYKGLDMERIASTIAARESRLIQCPITVIYTRRDGIVAWGASIDRHHAHARHVETAATHFGLVVHPQTLRQIAEALAQP